VVLVDWIILLLSSPPALTAQVVGLCRHNVFCYVILILTLVIFWRKSVGFIFNILPRHNSKTITCTVCVLCLFFCLAFVNKVLFFYCLTLCSWIMRKSWLLAISAMSWCWPEETPCSWLSISISAVTNTLLTRHDVYPFCVPKLEQILTYFRTSGGLS
jgi:hypothetical protein